MRKYFLRAVIVMNAFIPFAGTAQTFSAAPPIPIKGVTAGFSVGYNYLFKTPYDYFLTPDIQHNLELQKSSHSNFVVSTVISIRLGKPATQQQTVDGVTHKKIVDLNTISPINSSVHKAFYSSPIYEANKKCHWTLNIGLNLLDISTDIAFNKSIDGGLGIGYMINEYSQVAFFLDMLRYRQLRDYIVKNYEGKSISNGNDVYNALDEKNNNLYYNKYFPGLSVKLIFTINNQ